MNATKCTRKTTRRHYVWTNAYMQRLKSVDTTDWKQKKGTEDKASQILDPFSDCTSRFIVETRSAIF